MGVVYFFPAELISWFMPAFQRRGLWESRCKMNSGRLWREKCFLPRLLL